MSSGFSEKQGFVGVAQCRGLTKISFRSILSLFCICPTLIPIFLKTEERSPFSKIFGYKWTGLKLVKDNNNLFCMIKLKKSLFSTHKKDLCTVVHLKRIKTKFVP